ncbi:MAG TPA: MmcQ/YjbR family DNA-binding protein [Thermomicrobiales bacterium]|nr:MmcQ/YjbR family DNA-binding protein [Thermomicrobiales bacterium]
MAIGRALPEVEESTSYGTPALKVKGKLLARLRSDGDGGLMLRCALEEKELLLQSGDPSFYTTPHYDGYAAILIDLERVDVTRLTEMIDEAWYLQAPVKVRKLREAQQQDG